MIDILKMKALAAKCREPASSWDVSSTLGDAANAIESLLSELEAREADRRDALPDGLWVSGYRMPSGVKIVRTMQIKGPDKWKVTDGFSCLNKNGEWEYEPIPSARDKEFLARCRFDSAQEAIDAALAQRQEGEEK